MSYFAPDDILELLKEFKELSGEIVDSIERLILQMEGSSGPEVAPNNLKEILGLLHTLKGNSGMIGFHSMQTFCHTLEDFFKGVQAGTIQFGEEALELSLNAVNWLRAGLISATGENTEDPDVDAHTAAIAEFITRQKASANGTGGNGWAKASNPSNMFAQKTSVLKVDFERLDHLLDLMGELVIFRTKLGRVESQFREDLGDKGLVLELGDTSEQIGKVTTELHEAIMRVRMLPIRQVFSRFPRFVRDIAKEAGKEISLQFEGEETELDKTVIDEIGEPLMHLVRNSVDHGIETKGERESKGKPLCGRILLKAFQESSHIVITIEDDGRGIDSKKLESRAISLGLIEKSEASKRDLIDLLCLPGLTTAEKVTEGSGRGLGMDVVKTSLARINGSIEVHTDSLTGTQFAIKLPLTLAIISALMVSVSGEMYAIPLSSVMESIKVPKTSLHIVNRREVVQLRDRVLPLVRLSRLFGLPDSEQGNHCYVVIAQGAVGRVGLIVDSLVGRQEIVIKPLDDTVGEAKGVAGATILGDGKVVLIIDVSALTEVADHHGGEGLIGGAIDA